MRRDDKTGKAVGHVTSKSNKQKQIPSKSQVLIKMTEEALIVYGILDVNEYLLHFVAFQSEEGFDEITINKSCQDTRVSKST